MSDTPIDFNDDYIDLRDMQARLTALAELELDGSIDDGERRELELIRTTLDDVGTCGGTQLIREGVFEDYIRDFTYDVGAVDPDSSVTAFIDWKRLADSARIDYREIVVKHVDAEGVEGDIHTFLIRS